MLKKLTINSKGELVEGIWNPAILADVNNQVKLVRFKDEFIRHKHEHEDQMFSGFNTPVGVGKL